MGRLSVSILSADLAHLAEQVKRVHEHADVIHIDVTDAHFVPQLTIGPVVVASLRPHTKRTLHGHLLVEEPEGLFDELADAGTDVVSFHVEAVPEPGPVIAKARGAGLGVGLAVSPETSVEVLSPHLEEIDDVIVMSAHPERPQRSFLSGALPKVEAVRTELDRRGLSAHVEVDGGVNLDNARRCVDAGADVLVVGSGIFQAEDVTTAARELKAVVGSA